VAAVAALAAVLVVPTSASAQDDDGSTLAWGVRPSSPEGPDGRDAFVYELAPGDAVDDHVAVSNLSEEPVTFAVYASDAFTTADGGFDVLAANQSPVEVGAWVRFEVEQVTVPARSSVDVPFRLTVPANTTPGDHAGGVVASLRTTAEDDSGAALVVDNRVGVRIYLRVSGDLVPQVVIRNLRASYDGSLNPLSGGTPTATYTVANTGNVRIAGTARVRATGPFGVAPRTVDAPEIAELLPGDELSFTIELDNAQPTGRSYFTVTLDPVAVGATDVDIPAATATDATWAIPWMYIALVLLAAGAIWSRHHRRRRPRPTNLPSVDPEPVGPESGSRDPEHVGDLQTRDVEVGRRE
jgi:hypothetical protein